MGLATFSNYMWLVFHNRQYGLSSLFLVGLTESGQGEKRLGRESSYCTARLCLPGMEVEWMGQFRALHKRIAATLSSSMCAKVEKWLPDCRPDYKTSSRRPRKWCEVLAVVWCCIGLIWLSSEKYVSPLPIGVILIAILQGYFLTIWWVKQFSALFISACVGMLNHHWPGLRWSPAGDNWVLLSKGEPTSSGC